MARILTQAQSSALKLIANTPLPKSFYLAGGTALAEYYLHHRKSEDLDFFSKKEVNPEDISVILGDIQKKLGAASLEYQSSMNRNLYFMHFDNEEILKLEFTYFPFEQIEAPKILNGIPVDSLIDIATNKLFTILQNPRGRDYYDLYAIHNQKVISIEKLRMLAKQKFDWHIDPLQLAAQLNKVSTLLDDPILEIDIKREDVQKYFESQALKLKNEMLKK